MGSEIEGVTSRVTVNAPRYLYKYRDVAEGLEPLKNLLMNGEVWFATRKSFNDPFDCQPRVSLKATKQELRRYAKQVFRDLPSRDRKKVVDQVVSGRRERAARDLESVRTKLDHALDTQAGIFCLSAKNDDLLMWGHYARSHTGVCVQFDLTAGDPILARALPVTYQETYPVVRPIVQHGFSSFSPVFSTKSDRWAYEKEWRVVDLGGGPGLRNLNLSAVSGVILGARLAPSIETAIREWAGSRDPSVRITRAKLGEYRYEVSCSDIEVDYD